MTGAWLAAFTMGVMPASAQQQQPVSRESDKYDDVFKRYLDGARATPPVAQTSWINGLMGDFRARGLNDVVLIRVMENVSANGAATSSLSKNSAAKASVAKAFGLTSKLPDWLDPTSLVQAGSDTSFDGSGATTRSGDLTAIVSARVADVLPNGDLVVEGIREIDINGDRQIIVLTGVVRPHDIGRDNSVVSPQVGQLRIRYFARGLMKDNLQPGWLVRVLNKIF